MDEVDGVSVEGFELSWSPATRVASLHGGPYGTGAAAEVLVNAFSRWIAPGDRRAFAMLADGSRLDGMSPRWRALFGAFFKQHRDHAFIALTNIGPVVRVTADLFRIATGVQLRAFADTAAAHAWLREQGMTAPVAR